MTKIPRVALILGLAGVLPFALPGLALVLGLASPFGTSWHAVQILYGLTILAFMSGCLWGFAAKGEDSTGYALSTLPALYGFFVLVLVTPISITATTVLFALGFAGLLNLDRRAAGLGQAPVWWMPLRVLLTSLVVLCLIAALAF
jgi:hypothetical protein